MQSERTRVATQQRLPFLSTALARFGPTEKHSTAKQCRSDTFQPPTSASEIPRKIRGLEIRIGQGLRHTLGLILTRIGFSKNVAASERATNWFSNSGVVLRFIRTVRSLSLKIGLQVRVSKKWVSGWIVSPEIFRKFTHGEAGFSRFPPKRRSGYAASKDSLLGVKFQVAG